MQSNVANTNLNPFRDVQVLPVPTLPIPAVPDLSIEEILTSHPATVMEASEEAGPNYINV